MPYWTNPIKELKEWQSDQQQKKQDKKAATEYFWNDVKEEVKDLNPFRSGRSSTNNGYNANQSVGSGYGGQASAQNPSGYTGPQHAVSSFGSQNPATQYPAYSAAANHLAVPGAGYSQGSQGYPQAPPSPAESNSGSFYGQQPQPPYSQAQQPQASYNHSAPGYQPPSEFAGSAYGSSQDCSNIGYPSQQQQPQPPQSFAQTYDPANQTTGSGYDANGQPLAWPAQAPPFTYGQQPSNYSQPSNNQPWNG